jgi:hypothetical protein
MNKDQKKEQRSEKQILSLHRSYDRNYLAKPKRNKKHGRHSEKHLNNQIPPNILDWKSNYGENISKSCLRPVEPCQVVGTEKGWQ